MKPTHVVEAALFSAGRAIGVDEIADQEGLSKRQVQEAISTLSKQYDERDTVLEIKKAGAKWAMQVRRQAAEPAAKFAPMEIPAKTLKTLALIAYHQPIKQSDLKDMVGSKVYDHIPELKDRGLVKTRRDGQTKILTTTAAFPEYFGLDAATPEQIRHVIAKMVGIDPDQQRPRSVESFAQAEEPATPSQDEQEAPPPTDAQSADASAEETGESTDPAAQVTQPTA